MHGQIVTQLKVLSLICSHMLSVLHHQGFEPYVSPAFQVSLPQTELTSSVWWPSHGIFTLQVFVQRCCFCLCHFFACNFPLKSPILGQKHGHVGRDEICNGLLYPIGLSRVTVRSPLSGWLPHGQDFRAIVSCPTRALQGEYSYSTALASTFLIDSLIQHFLATSVILHLQFGKISP